MEAAIFCLAQALYFEARSEPITDQLMVANAIVNRVESDKYHNTICDVINTPYQFSYLNDGIPEKINEEKAWDSSYYWAGWYLRNPYKYHNGCHFHANYVKPYWAEAYTLVFKGKNISFYEGGC